MSTGRAAQPAGGRHRTPRFDALGHAFRVTTDRRELTSWFTKVLAPLTVDDGPAKHYEVVVAPGHGPRGLKVDGELVCATDDARHAVAMLLWYVNQQAVAHSRDLILLHAGGVSRGGAAAVMPAASGSGKSTLTAALVEAGFDYLSDEIVAVSRETWAIRPYQKPLTIKVGSQHVLRHLKPPTDEGLDGIVPDSWEVPATSIRPGSLATTAIPRLLVFPTYRSGAGLEVRGMSRADAVLLLAQSMFGTHDALAAALPGLAELARRCPALRLVYGDLDEARQAVEDMLGRAEDEPRINGHVLASTSRRADTLSPRSEAGYPESPGRGERAARGSGSRGPLTTNAGRAHTA